MSRPSVRDQLVEGGLQCFHAKGYKGTSIEDIAEAAGVLKGSFYNHFASKEDLAVIVVTKYAASVVEVVSLKGPPSAAKRLVKHFELLSTWQEAAAYRNGCLMSNFSAEIYQAGEPLRHAVEKAFAGWFAVIATVIRQAQAEGDIDPKQDPDQLARFMVNSWEGATNFSKVIRSGQPLDDFFAFSRSIASQRIKKTDK